MKTLGEKLKETIDELERAKIVKAEEQAMANREKLLKEREETFQFLDKMRSDFVETIVDGHVPIKKVEAYKWTEWLKGAKNGTSPNSDLWRGFVEFWIIEGLDVNVQENHDDMKSWLVISLKIRPARPRSNL